MSTLTFFMFSGFKDLTKVLTPDVHPDIRLGVHVISGPAACSLGRFFVPDLLVQVFYSSGGCSEVLLDLQERSTNSNSGEIAVPLKLGLGIDHFAVSGLYRDALTLHLSNSPAAHAVSHQNSESLSKV